MRKWYEVYGIEWEEDEEWLPSSQIITIEDNEVSDFNNTHEVEDFIEDTLEFETGCCVTSFGYKEIFVE